MTEVALVTVDDVVLAQLVHVATTRADADEVTPPVTAGPAWTPERVAWLQAFHRDRRAGLDGNLGEATWAVAVDAQVVGSVRLERTDDPSVLQTGAWLARDVRGQGVGRAAMAAVLLQAADLGVAAVRAETTAGNLAALNVLRQLGFDVTFADERQDVASAVVGIRWL